MTAGIVGLGLIGGSFAKAYKAAGHRVLAANRTGSVLKYALLSGDVDAELTADNIDSCDILILCLYPEAVTEYLREHAGRISEGTLVIDTCGTKRAVVDSCMALAEQYGFTFVGGHPMAGTQYSGYKYSRANLFNGAAMVIVPPDFGDIALLSRVKELLAPADAGEGAPGAGGLRQHPCDHRRRARPRDRVHVAADASGVQRVREEPYGRAAEGLYRRQLPGHDAGGVAESRYVGGTVSGERGQSQRRTLRTHHGTGEI